MFVTIGILYEEWKPETYRGVYVLGQHKEWRFEGTPTDALRKAVAFCQEQGHYAVFSSTVDNFIMDGGDLTLPNAVTGRLA